jgi:DNA repair photolyase
MSQSPNQDSANRPLARGRGAQIEPPNRFGQTYAELDLEHIPADDEFLADLENRKTVYLPDNSKSIISENDSPDIPFRYSLNPYRGCAHGCSYCYARPTHEYLGLNSGLDFETRIFFKPNAPKLFRDWLNRPKWQGETIVLSGITDCYQPAEQEYQLTRQCLEVAHEAGQPLGLITKNAMVTRDIDLLSEMAKRNTVSVALSITSLRQELTRTLEPRTSSPDAKLRAIKELSEAGIPTHVMLAPIIPGLNDHEIPAILEAAAKSGAISANYTLVRFPYAVEQIFFDWLRRTHPDHVERVETRIRSTRDGQLKSAEFGKRMSGTGVFADQIAQAFRVFSKRYGLVRKMEPLTREHFRPPKSSSGQMTLF